MLVGTKDYGDMMLYECPSCGYKLYRFKGEEVNMTCPECENRERNEKYIEHINRMIAPSGFVAERIFTRKSIKDKVYQIVEVSCMKCGVIKYYLLADLMEGNFKKSCNHNLASKHNIYKHQKQNYANMNHLAELTEQWKSDCITAKDMICDLNGNKKFIINKDDITGRTYIELLNKYEPRTKKLEIW